MSMTSTVGRGSDRSHASRRRSGRTATGLALTKGNAVVRPANTRSPRRRRDLARTADLGSRLHNDQTPWLLLLEALNIMAAYASDKNVAGNLPGTRITKSALTECRRVAELRHLLFRDRSLDEIAASQSIADGSQWTSWLRTAFKRCGEKRISPPIASSISARSRNAVALLRGAEVESERHRRPTSRHLAPRGTDMLDGRLRREQEDRSGQQGPPLLRSRRRASLLHAQPISEIREQARTFGGSDPLLERTAVGTQLAQARSNPSSPSCQSASIQFGYLPLGSHPALRSARRRLGSTAVAGRLARRQHPRALDAAVADWDDAPIHRRTRRRHHGRKAASVPDRHAQCRRRSTSRSFRRTVSTRHRELSRKAIKKLAQTLDGVRPMATGCKKPKSRKALCEMIRSKALRYSPEVTRPERHGQRDRRRRRSKVTTSTSDE